MNECVYSRTFLRLDRSNEIDLNGFFTLFKKECLNSSVSKINLLLKSSFGLLESSVCMFNFDNIEWMLPPVMCIQCLGIVHPRHFALTLEITALMEQESRGTRIKILPASRQSVLNRTSKYTAA